VGVVLYLELALLGRLTPYQVRYPVLAGLLFGVLQLIPQIGPLIGTLLVFILSLPAGIQFALVMLGVYLIAQFVVNQLVAGQVNRRVIDLNPALLALFLTALSQFGLMWVLLSAPILSITRDLFRYAYGRFGDPPRSAGVLPGETVRSPLPAGQPARSPTTSVEGGPPPRRAGPTMIK
jgi:predicted PurR-regulated permease PerM